MDIEAEVDLVADRLAHGLELGNGGTDRPPRLQQFAVLRQPPAHEFPALLRRLQAGVDQRLDLHSLAAVVRIADDLVADLAAQQIVDRHAQRLALDIPQRHVDGGNGRGLNALSRKESAPVELLPDVLGVERALSDQQRFEVLQGADHGQFPAGESRLTHAIDTLVRVDHEEEEVAMTAPDRKGFDIGDFHALSPVRTTKKRESDCMLVSSFQTFQITKTGVWDARLSSSTHSRQRSSADRQG